MSKLQSILLALGTITSALAIGVFMQFGAGSPDIVLKDSSDLFENVTPTSSAAVIPGAAAFRAPPGQATPVAASTGDTMQNSVLAAADTISLDADLPVTTTPVVACNVDLTLDPTVSAMVNVDLAAPCLPNARVTLHHAGVMFTELTDADGGLQLTVPALLPEVVVIASFEGGEGAVAQTRITSLAQFHRVAVQWQGGAGLQLHALEFGANYFEPGHIWAEAPGLPNQADAGFLTKLGDPALPGARHAEVYTYPVGLSKRSGSVDLSVETEITADNCSQQVSAQTIETSGTLDLRVQDLDLILPDCSAIGEFLVLKNMVEDLKVAAN